MAERRMLTKKVTDDDNFMQLSSSAQALYLHLNMSADDDGFCNQVAICMFKAHASVQDLESLLERRYIYQFENGVIVIKHWRMANALRKDRYTPTAFKEELAKLRIKTNGAYTMSHAEEPAPELDGSAEEEHIETARQAAYRESNLPYSFDYKIRRAFYGKPCPICGIKMQTHIDECGISSDMRLPTIQHNIPISKGGKHELGNISVICHQCNVEIQDKPTERLNADEVIEEWEKISGCRLVANCLPQDRLDKDSIDKVNNNRGRKAFAPPTLEEVKAYCLERKNNVDAEKFYAYYSAGHWIDSKGKPVRNWKQKVITWEKSGDEKKPKVTTAANYEAPKTSIEDLRKAVAKIAKHD